MSSTYPAPNFVVIGAMRAGTTTLYELMRQSGAVSVPRTKETDFFMFARNHERGLKWFAAQFDDLSHPICDFSSNYSRRGTFPEPARRIHQTNPNAKIIYIVRDPVKRAISQFRHMVASGFDMPDADGLVTHREGQVILDASSYAHQLDAYTPYWSIDDIIILDFDKLIRDQFGTLVQLYDRLGIPHDTRSLERISANGSSELQRMPAFWGRLRRSDLGERMRQIVPRELLNRTKRLVASLTPEQELAPFSSAAEQFVRAGIADDVARFRKMTGLSFDHWSI